MAYVRSRASWPAWPDPNSLIRNTDLENFDATLLSHDGSIASQGASIATLLGLAVPAGSVSGQVPVWNGSAWVPGKVGTNGITPGSAGQVLGMLSGAASWLGGLGSVGEQTLGASAATIDFSALSQDYKHLLIVAYLRGDTAANFTTAAMRFNNDSTNAYDFQVFTANSTTLAGGGVAGGATSSAQIGRIPANTAPANAFGPVIAFIPNYKTTAGHKGYFALSASRELTGGLGDTVMGLQAGIWAGVPAAITRVTVIPGAGNFVTGSEVSVYGIG